MPSVATARGRDGRRRTLVTSDTIKQCCGDVQPSVFNQARDTKSDLAPPPAVISAADCIPVLT